MSCCFHAQIPFSFSNDWHLCLFQFPKTFRSPSNFQNFQTKRLSTLFSVSIVALISSVNPLFILYLAIIEALVIFVFIPIAQKLGCWYSNFFRQRILATKNVTFQPGRNSAACRVERGSLRNVARAWVLSLVFIFQRESHILLHYSCFHVKIPFSFPSNYWCTRDISVHVSFPETS